MNFRQYLIIIITYGLFFFNNSCAQDYKNRMLLGEDNAKKELFSAINDTTLHNVINKKDILISDKKTAIDFAETVLFKVYGKENITKQRPYEVYDIENYWVISGTLPKEYLGGTFLIIIDSRDYRIVRITHGK